MRKDQKLLQVLQFLALGNREKLICLPKIPIGMKLEIFETSIRTDNALFCVGYECYDCIDRHKFGANDAAHILSEMECLLDAMISYKDRRWMWNVGDPGLSNSTHLFWLILKRLAKDALKLRDWPEAMPRINLEDFITVGRWVRKSKAGPPSR